jgi:hypothetical protein
MHAWRHQPICYFFLIHSRQKKPILYTAKNHFLILRNKLVSFAPSVYEKKIANLKRFYIKIEAKAY